MTSVKHTIELEVENRTLKDKLKKIKQLVKFELDNKEIIHEKYKGNIRIDLSGRNFTNGTIIVVLEDT